MGVAPTVGAAGMADAHREHSARAALLLPPDACQKLRYRAAAYATQGHTDEIGPHFSPESGILLYFGVEWHHAISPRPISALRFCCALRLAVCDAIGRITER